MPHQNSTIQRYRTALLDWLQADRVFEEYKEYFDLNLQPAGPLLVKPKAKFFKFAANFYEFTEGKAKGGFHRMLHGNLQFLGIGNNDKYPPDSLVKNHIGIQVNEKFEEDKKQLIKNLESHHDDLRLFIKIVKGNYNPSQTSMQDIVESETQASSEILHINQILYGPPGTGKTFATIELAVKACLSSKEFEDLGGERNQLRKAYDELVDRGQIEFVTFHQSFSYEDFVEGIKPILPRDEDEAETDPSSKTDSDLSYQLTPGVFKRICSKADTKISASENFDHLWENFANHLLNQKDEVIFQSTESEMRLEKEMSTSASFKIRFLKSFDPTEPEGKKVFTIGKETIRKIYDEKVDVRSEAKTKWIKIRDVVGSGRATLCLGIYKKLWEYGKDTGAFSSEDNKKIYVLIIDEINRGNVSQTFGELITLIEKDKRLGGKEALEVTLPYSKEKFGVPSNLYIIGTMNTADRSVEALDTALRRRFAFKEVAPEPNLLSSDKLLWYLWQLHWKAPWKDEKWIKQEGSLLKLLGGKKINQDRYYEEKELNWQDGLKRNMFEGIVAFDGIDVEILLTTINERIELLIDKDHVVGHSYFFSLIGSDDCERELMTIFYDKIIPLLEEYFYGDFGKIGLVLGKSFVRLKEKQKTPFADFDHDDKALLMDKPMYEIIDYRQKDTPDFLEAVLSVYSLKNTTE